LATGLSIDRVAAAETIMSAFARRTGIDAAASPRRYLWTDAFAVCNYLSLHRHTHSPEWRDNARALIEQVHHVLGRHRSDDPRTGWISGLSDDEGERHPTAGGLRIGKSLPERRASDPFDERLEWESDGQYYHYLTRWMHALERAAADLHDEQLLEVAVELAKAAHAAFAHEAYGEKRLYWKMSIDLARPLVTSMGQHDALDGLVVTATLHHAGHADPRLDLRQELSELSEMCTGSKWTTTDPLGLGLVLTDALFLSRLCAARAVSDKLFVGVMRDATRSLELVDIDEYVDQPASQRLPFRELGLSLGLAAVERLDERRRISGLPGGSEPTAALAEALRYIDLRTRIESFWLDSAHQAAATWTEHEDINAVMLATSMLPDGYLD
jgi:hypothetical protein